MRLSIPLLSVLLAASSFCQSIHAEPGPADPKPENRWKGIVYREIGPAIGGRITRVSGIAGDPLTYYAATAQGGVWKSNNGGQDWAPIFDEQITQSIGSIAPSEIVPRIELSMPFCGLKMNRQRIEITTMDMTTGMK